MSLAPVGDFVNGPASATDGAFAAFDGTSGKLIKAATLPLAREVLTANRTYYVRTDGNDSNTGLVNNSGGAFLTIQRAVDATMAIDISIYNVTIQVAAGTYAGTVYVTGPWVGSGTVTIVGDTTTPTNCVWNSSVSDMCLRAISGARVAVGGFHFSANAGAVIALYSSTGGVLTMNGQCNFGACSAAHIYPQDGGFVYVSANYTISGNALYHMVAEANCFIRCQYVTVTASGSRAFSSAYAGAGGGYVISNGNTFTGTFTGPRYQITAGGAINTFGSGATYFPGNSGGTGGTTTGAGFYG